MRVIASGSCRHEWLHTATLLEHTRLFHVLVHDDQMFVVAVSSPTGNLPHLKLLAFLSANKFTTGENANYLLAKIVGNFSGLRRRGDENFRSLHWVVRGREIGREGVIGNILCCLFLYHAFRRAFAIIS